MKQRIRNALAVIRPQQPYDLSLEAVKKLVLDSLTSEHSKASYGIAITAFCKWFLETWRGDFNKAAVNAYKAKLLASGYAPATCNARLAAVRALAREAADNNLLPNDVAAAIFRVKCVRMEGTRTGNWLTKEQAELLLNAPDTTTIQGLRDLALLSLLIGCRIRRQESCDLTFEHLQVRDSRWVILDLQGKGKRIRTVPMPAWTKAAIDTYAQEMGINTGIILRQAGRRFLMGEALSTTRVWQIVRRHAAAVGIEHIAPHDLRRTWAKLCHQGGAAMEQIQISLGHASIVTTQKYLGTKQNLGPGNAPCDFLGLGAPRTRRRSKDMSAASAISPVDRAEPASETLAAYARDWREFESWATAKGLTALPAVPETVVLYLADHSHLKRGSLEVRLTAITKAHKAAGYPSPASRRDPAIAEAWKAATHTVLPE
jgi:site-specific recombinase XerD